MITFSFSDDDKAGSAAEALVKAAIPFAHNPPFLKPDEVINGIRCGDIQIRVANGEGILTFKEHLDVRVNLQVPDGFEVQAKRAIDDSPMVTEDDYRTS